MVYEVTGKRYLLKIGRAAEHRATEFVVNIKPWLDLWPNGAGAVLIQRPEDEDFYTALDVTQDNEAGTLTWKPDSTDTAQATTRVALKIQVVYTNGTTVIARAPIWSGRIESSLIDGDNNPPTVVAPWVEQVLDAAAHVFTSTAQADAWADTFEWILDEMDTHYPAVQTFLETVTDINSKLDTNIRYDPGTKMISLGCSYDSLNQMIIIGG